MNLNQACKLLNTSPTRSPEYLRGYAATRLETFTPQAPLRYKVAATLILRSMAAKS